MPYNKNFNCTSSSICQLPIFRTGQKYTKSSGFGQPIFYRQHVRGIVLHVVAENHELGNIHKATESGILEAPVDAVPFREDLPGCSAF